MSWYRTGTVSVTNGNTTVIGTGTAWVANAAIGHAFIGPEGTPYEIANVVSDTEITLGSAFLGATAAGQSYSIQPTQSYMQDLAAEVVELIGDFAAVRDGAGEGLFGDGTAALPGVRFTADQDTGIYRVGANALGFAVAGALAAQFIASGDLMLASGKKLGIGGVVTTPAYLIDAQENTGSNNLSYRAIFGDTFQNRAVRLGSSSSGGVIQATGAQADMTGFNLLLNPNGGNVGIGISAPSEKLHVAGSAILNNDLTFANSSTALNTTRTSPAIYSTGTLGAAYPFLEAGHLVFQSRATGADRDILFVTGATPGIRMVITGTGPVRPGADNTQTLGSASFRWSVVYAGTGTINTSDERDKTWRGELSDAEYQAGLAVLDELGFYQWNDAIEEKGADGARYHFGVRAQRVWQIFAAAGLADPIEDGKPGRTPCAFLCYDEWDEQRGPVLEERTREVETGETDEAGDPVTVTETYQHDTGETKVLLEAGARFGIRATDMTLFLLAVQARRHGEIEARLAALEASAS